MKTKITALLLMLPFSLNVFALGPNEMNVSPVGVSVISGSFSPSPPSYLNAAIDLSGLQLTNFATDDLSTIVHDPADQYEMRLFSGSTVTIRLDLGADYALNTAYLWNNDSQANNNVGTYEYTFRNSTLNSLGTSGDLEATNVTFLNQLPPDVYDLNTPLGGVRYVDMRLDRRAGSSLGLYGVGEVAFKAIPEPASASLICIIAGAAYFGRRFFTA